MDRRRHFLIAVVGSLVAAVMMRPDPLAAGEFAAVREAAFARQEALGGSPHRDDATPLPPPPGHDLAGLRDGATRDKAAHIEPGPLDPPWMWSAFADLGASDQRRAIANLRALLSIERNRPASEAGGAAAPLEALRAREASTGSRAVETTGSGEALAGAGGSGSGMAHASVAANARSVSTAVPEGKGRPVRAGERMASASGHLFVRLMGARGTIAPGRRKEIVAVLAEPEPRSALELALLELRLIEALGGWIAVDPARARSLDDPDLVARLLQSGDLDLAALENPPDRATIEAALRRFQTRHGLAADGIIGPRTAAALGRPVSAQIASLSSNLRRERGKRAPILAGRYVEVDIPGQVLRLVENGAVRLETRVIVGRIAKPTPDLADSIRYIELDPSWYVPASIIPELLARESLEPGYLDAAGFTRHTSADGSERLVQVPGPANALGRFKFGFPNHHAVYLHDTPHRDLFDRTARDLSHGCVRVEDPERLALALLERTGWTAERLHETLSSTPRTRRITLAEPVPVFLRYRTAFVGPQGRVHFRADPYHRDAPGSLRVVARDDAARRAPAMLVPPDHEAITRDPS